MSYQYDPCNPCVPDPCPCPCPPLPCVNAPIFTSVTPSSVFSTITSTIVVSGFNLGNVQGVTFSNPGLVFTSSAVTRTLNPDGTLSLTFSITPDTLPTAVQVTLSAPPCPSITFPIAVLVGVT